MQFEYSEDKKYFADLLTGGDLQRFEKEYFDSFDFRLPAIKRKEFEKLKKNLLLDLRKEYSEKCQLHVHPDCNKVAVFEVDHIIPLSSNQLNKELRHMVSSEGFKVPAQSFGSNNPKNLTLSCKRCNAYKKHRILVVSTILQNNINATRNDTISDAQRTRASSRGATICPNR